MSRTFFPELFELVPASAPHPPKTQYKIGIGMENWDEAFVSVVKVQMVYDGVVAGRRSPSYPMTSQDYMLVNQAILRLIAQHEKNNG